MESRHTETETRVVAPGQVSAAVASGANMQAIATNMDTSDNGPNAPTASYSMSTLALIPGLSLSTNNGQQPSSDINREQEKGRDALQTTLSNSTSALHDHHHHQQQQQQPYVPQFSAATSLILNRIKGGSEDFNSALVAASATITRPDKIAFEEAKMRLIKKMNASRTDPSTPEPSNSAQSQTKSRAQSPATDPTRDPGQGGAKDQTPSHNDKAGDASQQGTKRKRELGEDDVRDKRAPRDPINFDQNTIPFPFQENQALELPAQAPVIEGMCVKCGSSSSTPLNVLFACALCSAVCHKACSFPLPVTTNHKGSGGVDSGQSPSLCPSCNLNQSQNHAQAQPEPLRRKQKIERIRQMRLAALPEGVVPAKPELVGFGPGAASDRARAEYFSNMTKTDALNLLSFCDQLRPQLLIDVMVSVSKRHPDLLMFNSPDWNASESRSSVAAAAALPSSSRTLAPAAAVAHVSRKANLSASRPPHGRSLLNSKAKQKIKPSSANGGTGGTGSGGSGGSSKQQSVVKRPTKRVQQQHPPVDNAARNIAAPAPVSGGDVAVDEDAPPPTWPKAGSGLYVKLAPEINDRLFLADENDEEAFSHFMVDKMGRQIIDPV